MLDAIRRRRSIRHYEDRPVSAEQIEQLQEAMLRSPSSRNLQPWRFVFVTDRELLRSLAHARPTFAEWIGGAPLGVVICADAAVSDCWIEDASIAAATLQLAATDLGLGTCWMQIRAREHESGRPAAEYVREVLELPYQLRVLCMISVGHPAEQKAPKERATLSWDSIETR
jgi:nitroreductase